MHAIDVMFDSLRFDILQSTEIDLPNFKRLKEHSISFTNCYICSLPCMPARREMHTGRPNFLHRSWGPLEPFDDSAIELLKTHGIYTHLSTDHYHYLEDGGATYHNRYNSWVCFRGQENDAWIGDCTLPRDTYAPILLHHDHQNEPLKTGRLSSGWQNVLNRNARHDDHSYSQTLTFDNGIEFIYRNHSQDNWYLQIECFDPHEPFDSPSQFLSHFFNPDAIPPEDWPPYAKVDETKEEIENMRKKYSALVQYCDTSLGRVLDVMDELELWKDTMLIVNTDHGFCLAEHDWWGKNNCPEYQEVAHIPLFLYDPRIQQYPQQCHALVQTIDFAPTILDFFQLPIPKDMMGKPLRKAYEENKDIREYALFGFHGSTINITDGRYVYMRAVRTTEEPVVEVTLLPLRMNGFFTKEELSNAKLTTQYSFQKDIPSLKSQEKRDVVQIKKKKILYMTYKTIHMSYIQSKIKISKNVCVSTCRFDERIRSTRHSLSSFWLRRIQKDLIPERIKSFHFIQLLLR